MSDAQTPPPAAPKLLLGTIYGRWWPLACSWLLMGMELPAVSAVIARLPDARIHLAAYGGIVFPLCLLIESPVIMLLATSTALARDWESYRTIRRFTNVLAGSLTAVHVAVAFTPLWDVVAVHLLDAPPATIEPGRIGLQLMTPWTWAIALRRFQQGILIRFGHSRAVGIGTVVRLLTGATTLAICWRFTDLPGVAVGAGATALAVTLESLYVFVRVQPVIREQLRHQIPIQPPLGIGTLTSFHTPLALTSLFHLLSLPLASAAMGRMPESLMSLAAWPVVHGLTFIFRSIGLAYTEVVVVFIEHPNSLASLRRFAVILAGSTSLALLFVAATPLNMFWLRDASGLGAEVATLAATALWLTVVLPGVGAMSSFYQGLLVSVRRTRVISGGVIVGLMMNSLVLAIGLYTAAWSGLFVAIAAAAVGNVAQASYLAAFSRSSLRIQ